VLVQPGSIRFTSTLDLGNPQAIREELRYFSFVTLTTVGYGDVTPLSPAARALATLEALSGQIYLAVTLARLVSNRVTERRDSRVRTAARPRVRDRAAERDQETPT
jgi:voltage-gated potassium channel Kch